MRIFTDGACSGNPGPGGWGVVFCEKDKINKYSGCETDTTNNRMELKAVCKALHIYGKDYKDKEAVIYSDSAYVINAMNKGWIDNWRANSWKTSSGEDVKNQDLWRIFLACMRVLSKQGKQVEFVKVKGHSGNTLNEEADQLARKEVEKLKTHT